MRRVLVDTNVLIDLVSETRPSNRETVAAVRAALASGVDLLALASSLKDVYDVYERHYGSESDARRAVALIMDLFRIVDLTASVAAAALVSVEPDFEDGLVRETAVVHGCDALLTRDAPGFLEAPFRKLTAAELAHELSHDELKLAC